MIGVIEAFAGLGMLLGLMALGLPIAVAIFAVAAYAALTQLGTPLLLGFGDNLWGTLDNFILTAIPLFVLLGEILLRAGVTERMYEALNAWLNRLPGGLLHTNIGASAVFAAISGSSVATAATIGTVALPALKERGYGERLALGSIAAGATLGILIPPSINMIIYGAITNTSVGRLFAAGILPGVLLALAFMGVIVLIALLRPSVGGSGELRVPWSVRWRMLGHLAAPGLVFVVVMGSIYTGWATPTESAALGVIAAVAIAIGNGRFSLAMLHEAFLATMRTTAVILLILAAAFYMNFVLGVMGVPAMLTGWVADLGVSPVGLVIALAIFYLVLGCFIETLSMMIATIAITVPMLVQMGFDPIWCGIFLVLMMEISLFTPPIGMNLYVVQSVRGEGDITDVMLGALPFLATMIGFVALITAWPEMVLWLPRWLGI